MRNRKIISMLVAVSLVAVVGIGATLAYFTDTANVANVITMGNVDISLDETGDGIINDAGDTGLIFENIVPGDVLDKDPTITVGAESQDAYLRIKIDITGAAIDDEILLTDEILDCLYVTYDPDDAALTEKFLDSDDWVASGDYYYYQGIVSATDVIGTFNYVVIPATWDNDQANATFNIAITAEAIQADNVTEDLILDDNGTPADATDDNIVGWPAAAILEF